MTDPTNRYDPGTQKLVDDLRAKPQSFNRDELVRWTRRYHFHDYKSQHSGPKIVLVAKLTAAGFLDLADKARQGEYDQGKADADEWATSPEGRGVFKQFAKDLKQHPNDDDDQRKLRVVGDEIQQLCDARGVGGVVFLVSPLAASWTIVIPKWVGIVSSEQGFVVQIRGSTEEGLQRTESTMHFIGSLRDILHDTYNMFARLFRTATEEIRKSGGEVEHATFGGGAGTRPDPEGGGGN